MQKSEKAAEPSMEEILASIRKIIAEEPPQAPATPPAAPAAQSQPLDSALKDLAGPPRDDLSDILDEPAKQDTPQEPAQPAVPSSEASGIPAPPAKLENDVSKSPFAQSDETAESPLMARLRGLAGSANGAASAPPAPETNQPFAKQIPAADSETKVAPAEDGERANRSLQDAIKDARSGPADEQIGALTGSITETVFGKSAAAGIEHVPISISPEDEESAEQVSGEASEMSAEPTPTPVAASPDQPIKAESLQIDDVFASLTNDPAAANETENEAAAKPLPVLPHQEVQREQQPEPVIPEQFAPVPAAAETVAPETVAPETVAPEPVGPEPVGPEPATVEPIAAAPVAVDPELPIAAEPAPPIETNDPAPAETQPAAAAPSSPRADLEVALAALVEPVVKRWLADNVPAMVERILEEKLKEK